MLNDFSEQYCICGHCHKAFKYKDVAYKIATVVGMPMKEKVCPHCGRTGFTSEAHIEYFSNKGEN